MREALDYIREHGYEAAKTLNMVYVVDDGGHIIDDIRVRRFLLSPLDRPGARPARREFHRCSRRRTTGRRRSGCSRNLTAWRVPVVDDNRKIIGHRDGQDDMLDVAGMPEATEDIQKMGGSEALDEPYTTIALHRGSVKQRRAGWWFCSWAKCSPPPR